MGHQSSEAPQLGKMQYDSFESLLLKETFDGGFKIDKLTDGGSAELKHRVVDTMMRVSVGIEEVEDLLEDFTGALA